MLAIPPRRYFRTNVQIACILPQNTIHVNIIGFFVKKLAYLIFLLYLCSRFLNGGLRTPNLERFLQLDYSDVGWRIHSAPIEHPFSIHWNMLKRRWKEAYRGHRLLIGETEESFFGRLSEAGKESGFGIILTPKTTTGIQCRDNKQRTPEYDSGLIDEKKRDGIPHKRRSQKDGILCLTRDETI